MDEKKIDKTTEVEIDLKRILKAVLNKAWLIVIVSVLAAVLTLVSTVLFVTPQYESSVMFYVNNNDSLDEIIGGMTSGDISVSRSLVKTYMVILKTRETITEVVDYAEVDYSYGQVKNMITAESVDATEIFQVTVTCADPQDAAALADAIAHVLPDRIDDIIDGTSSKVVSYPVVATGRSSPSYTQNTLIGFLAGLLLTALVIVLYDIFDTTIRSEEDLDSTEKRPVLAAIPDMEAIAKSHRYGYGYRKGYARSAYIKEGEASPTDKVILVGGAINYAAAEAYKLLRTKVQFSFADDADCHIIGVSSAMTGEGKSLTAVNLAYSMSQLGKRVLLIDCDMRRPSVADKLPVKSTPGLSDYLSGQARSDYLIQHCGLEDDVCAFHVISAGRIPPNPMELLSSNKMERMLDALRANYDYIVLDLPPIGEVGDALATCKLTDGILMVARQDYCNRLALNAAIRQFEFAQARILGIVLNCANEESGSYKKYYKRYGKYYKRYGQYAPQNQEKKETANNSQE